MTKNAKSMESTVEIHARTIECRMVEENLTMEAANFQPSEQDDAGEPPSLVIYFDRGVKQVEAANVLRAIIVRIEGDCLPPVKVAVPSAIMELIKEREIALQAIYERLDGLEDGVRDCILNYMDERSGTTPDDEDEVDHGR